MKTPTEEQRAPDQDAAMEAAFVAGTLPEEDRRDDAKGLEALQTDEWEQRTVEKEPAPSIPTDADVLASAGVGSVFEKTAQGWRITYVDGGTKLFVSGPTLGDAVASHGLQVNHA